MKWLLCCLLALVLTSHARADIYKYEDSEGVVHFAEDPTDERFKVFMPPKKSPKAVKPKKKKAEPLPIPDKYLFNSTGADGGVWAVRTTNEKLKYFWYLGLEGRKLATVKGAVVSVGGAKYYQKDNEVVVSQYGEEVPLVRGTMGYYCYTYTMAHAQKR